MNHLLSCKRSKGEEAIKSFECYGRALDATPDSDWPDDSAASPDERLIADEVRTGCMTGMLLCLDREQRIVFVLGEIFETTDTVGAEIRHQQGRPARRSPGRAASSTGS